MVNEPTAGMDRPRLWQAMVIPLPDQLRDYVKVDDFIAENERALSSWLSERRDTVLGRRAAGQVEKKIEEFGTAASALGRRHGTLHALSRSVPLCLVLLVLAFILVFGGR